MIETLWAPDEWVEPHVFGVKYLNRGALRHFIRALMYDRHRVGRPVITLPAGWEVEVLELPYAYAVRPSS